MYLGISVKVNTYPSTLGTMYEKLLRQGAKAAPPSTWDYSGERDYLDWEMTEAAVLYKVTV